MKPATQLAPTYLVVDDDAVFRAALVRALTARRARVMAADSRASAAAILAEATIDRAIVDLRLGESSGVDVVRDIARDSPLTKTLVLTGYGSIATAIESIRSGAYNYLCKPTDVERILQSFEEPRSALAGPIAEPSLARVEWEHIQRVLVDCSGNVSEAARRLGLHRRSLQRKLSKYPALR